MSDPTPPPRARIGWWGRLLLLLAIIVIGMAAIAVYSQLRREKVGDLAALAEGDGVYLIVGSDSRENVPPDLGAFGDFPGQRADVIMLAQVAGGRRQLLSIPRDLKVEVPGEGTEKINAAYSLGGPELITETVALATGIRANHYLEIDFAGFAAIVDALGGIEVEFPYPARDLNSGLLVEVAGTHSLNGAAALAYARSRQYEELRDGAWVGESIAGDLARTGRQRQVLLEMLRKSASPVGLVRSPLVMLAAAFHLKSDADTNVLNLGRLGFQMVTSGETDSATLPVQISNEGGVSYVVPVPPATEVLAAFINRQPFPG
jgi:LCP family protein required for cell wall assembly